MSENRKQILEMMASGKINADEAERLLAALETGSSSISTLSSNVSTKAQPKYLRVVVNADDRGDKDGPVKVNVRIPMQLLRSGVRLAGFIPARVLSKANDAMREKGIPFDLSQVKPENLEEIIEQLHDLSVYIDAHEKDGNVNVRVFCE